MSETLRLVVNGEDREYAGGEFPGTVSDLIASFGLDATMVVAEVNGDIVRRDDFASHTLAGGDKIELVRFVGGG